MTQFRLTEYDAATDPIVKQVYAEIMAELGFGIVPNLFKSMAIRPKFLEANWKQFQSTILEGHMPRTLKEMIGVAISQSNGSEYALKVHLHSLSALGISEEVLRLLIADFDSCPLPIREKSIIEFGLKAANDSLKMTDADYQKLRDIGIEEEEIFEIIATANLFRGVNQYTDAIQLEIDAL